MDNIFLFSYGSNSTEQIKERINSLISIPTYPAYIKDYVRIFAGKSTRWCNGGICTIYPLTDKNVYGIVVKIKRQDLEKMNKYEVGYHLEIKDVYFNNSFHKTYVYIKDNNKFCIIPSSSYINAINKMLNEREKTDNRKILIRKLSSDNKIILLGYWSELDGFFL